MKGSLWASDTGAILADWHTHNEGVCILVRYKNSSGVNKTESFRLGLSRQSQPY